MTPIPQTKYLMSPEAVVAMFEVCRSGLEIGE